MTTPERRASDRVILELPLQLHLPDQASGRRVSAHLVDIGIDGHGAGLRVPLRSPVQLGGRVSLLIPHADPVRGIIVSRMGTPRYERLGVRIERDCAESLRALLA